jgi:polyprenyl-phospho-N-acetylgalactosaminyl synthase
LSLLRNELCCLVDIQVAALLHPRSDRLRNQTPADWFSILAPSWSSILSPMLGEPKARILVVVPAYNEASIIASVIASLIKLDYNVVIVDDGSTDRTGKIATLSGAQVLAHPINLGQGAALQTGIEFALRAGADYIVTFDADGQHQAADIARLIDALQRHNVDFALGSRFLGASAGIPLSRRILLKAAVWFTRVTTGLQVTDTHNGLRAMTLRGAQQIALCQNRMAHASEILEQIARSKLRYIEVPVTIEYSRYSLAKGQRVGDSLLILFDLSARRLYR